MTKSSTPLTASSARGLRVPRWARSPGWRATGMLTLLLALLFTCASYILSAQLAYPEILIDKPSFAAAPAAHAPGAGRSEEHTSELQSRFDLVCRLLLEKKK